MKVPGICDKCKDRAITKAYRRYCDGCAKELEVCSKCGEKKELVGSCYIDKNEKNVNEILYEKEMKGLGLR